MDAQVEKQLTATLNNDGLSALSRLQFPELELIAIIENCGSSAQAGNLAAVKYCCPCGQEIAGGRRKYCSLACANKRIRPSRWDMYHARARKHRKSSCEGCGSIEQLHAHHVDGKPKNNAKENIQTLCTHCHNFLHALAVRLSRPQPGRLPVLQGAS